MPTASFYGRLLPGESDSALANVDVQTEAGGSIATSQFTRYTIAPASTRTGTVKSGYSRKTARKALRKAAGGAKGSIFEESYLLGSLSRLVAEGGKLPLLVGKQSQIRTCLPGRALIDRLRIASVAACLRTIVRLSAVPSVVESLESEGEEGFIALANALEGIVADLILFARDTIDAVWEALGDAQLHDLETALLADADEEAAASAAGVLKRPEKPKMASLGHWQVGLLGLLSSTQAAQPA